MPDGTYVAVVRDITVIEKEITGLKEAMARTALSYAVEVGRRLVEAKEMLPHGEWGGWVKEKAGFSQSTANNMMRLYEEYGADQFTIFGAVVNSQAIANLPYTKALSLLSLPAEEREEFAEKVDAERLSTREFDKLVKDKLAADERAAKLQEAAKKAEAEAKESREAAARMEERLSGAIAEKDKWIKAKEETDKELKEAKEALASAEMKGAKAAQAKAEKAAQDAADGRVIELQRKLADADRQIEAVGAQAAMLEGKIAEAESRAKDAEAAAEKFRKGQAMADPKVQEFKVRFADVQKAMNQIDSLLAEVGDEETRGKLKKAMGEVVKGWVKRYGNGD